MQQQPRHYVKAVTDAPANVLFDQKSVLCNTGDYATGGGASSDLDNAAVIQTGPTDSFGIPTDTGQPSGWFGRIHSFGGAQDMILTVGVVCQTQ